MGYESDPSGLAALLRDCLSSGATAATWELFAGRTQRLIAPAIVRGLRQFGAVPTRELVDDLVQDTFLKLCERDLSALRRFRGERPEALVAYLTIAACNVARDHARASLAEKRGSGRVDSAADEVIAAAIDPATEREAADARILLDEIDRRLSESGAPAGARDRSIFWLYCRAAVDRAVAEGRGEHDLPADADRARPGRRRSG
jgi:RNA polymerase sigma-70 factor (ECF subfamily)